MESGLVDPLVDPRRHVELEAVHNFRDLGGYPARDGLITRWHQLYRSDGLHRLSAADIDRVRELGLRTVIDLRSEGEIEKWGTFPRGAIQVTYAHHPIIDQLWNVDHDDTRSDHDSLIWAYDEMLAVGAPRFAQAIELLAQPNALPAVFHCAAGKDRTGLLAAMVLESLGVPRSVVLADYELTVHGMQRMLAWHQLNNPQAAGGLADVPSWYMAALPDALGQVLERLATQHGSVLDYVLSIGVGAPVIEALATNLLVDP
jgi:protein-tyrosine phosphatase